MSTPLTPDPSPAEGPGDNADEACPNMPDGVALFPLIPEELGIHPLLLATLHAIVFFDGSTVENVSDDAANASLTYLGTYLQRLRGADLKRVREDMDCLIAFAKQEGWAQEELQFLRGFLPEFGVGQA